MESKQIWTLGHNALEWRVQPGQRHEDNYEMSGAGCDCIVDYGVDREGALLLGCSCYYPTLRTIPNDTHATLESKVPREYLTAPAVEGQPVAEYPEHFVLDGTLRIESRTDAGLRITRQFFPAAEQKCALQVVTVSAERRQKVSILEPKERVLRCTLGTKGVYVERVLHTADAEIPLSPGQVYTYCLYLCAGMANEPVCLPDHREELAARYRRIEQLCDQSMSLSTGIPELDSMVRFAKLRAGESIFDTLTGKFHSPGGRTYYAAVWCNDQVEYAGPHFAMTGDETAIEASLHAYRVYVPFMADNYAPIPSSVIAEGLDIWNGAGDRGDAAMYLYGASLFALYLGDRKVAEELYAPIQWCAEYCRRRTTPEGVIRSDTDELEKRIPTDGYANLSTSCLCYGGLLAAAKLADTLGDSDTATEYRHRAAHLKNAIETYFGAELHGYETYRYSRGFDTLRSWICLPLCVGIHNRSVGTVDAMLSEYLWTEEGMLSCEISDDNRDHTIWDRSTLYGFKAAFLAGQGNRVMEPLLRYCRKRLLCDRVPYAVEAYPEGGKRHLSAESALLVRVITEGLLGIAPESLNSFSFVPRLPEGMPYIDLDHLQIAASQWHIRVEREYWQVFRNGALCLQGTTDGNRVIVS